AEHAGAVDAQGARRLQVGLHAGPARRLRPRDRQHHRYPAHRLSSMVSGAAAPVSMRSARARSTTARSRAAAACGSSAAQIAEITATPSAPAAITAAALV